MNEKKAVSILNWRLENEKLVWVIIFHLAIRLKTTRCNPATTVRKREVPFKRGKLEDME
ncbi:MAG: hypothetical protein P8P28_00910 [Polaribacter sp.]|nr:hypothetical protein [Polaribacter sp.]MDG1246153.1 hypothetical protein [Polaribacter sp.]MDG1320566.1 hypothetical protein [Polaribacter sp.]